MIRLPLKELEEQLDPERFWRVHRNTIVRVQAIARVSHGDDGQAIVHLRNHERKVAVSRANAHRFR